VSALKTSRTPRRFAAFSTRAKDAAAQGVHGAREWTAPRLEDAADAVTASVAPRVSAALRSTARQVRPGGAKSTAGLRRLLNWRWLLGAGVAIAVAGTSAALAMRRRYAAATAEVSDAADAPEDESAPGRQTDADGDGDDTARSDANGQIGQYRR